MRILSTRSSKISGAPRHKDSWTCAGKFTSSMIAFLSSGRSCSTIRGQPSCQKKPWKMSKPFRRSTTWVPLSEVESPLLMIKAQEARPRGSRDCWKTWAPGTSTPPNITLNSCSMQTPRFSHWYLTPKVLRAETKTPLRRGALRRNYTWKKIWSCHGTQRSRASLRPSIRSWKISTKLSLKTPTVSSTIWTVSSPHEYMGWSDQSKSPGRLAYFPRTMWMVKRQISHTRVATYKTCSHSSKKRASTGSPATLAKSHMLPTSATTYLSTTSKSQNVWSARKKSWRETKAWAPL